VKYIATSKEDAEAIAAKAHAHKIATDPFYADAVAKGHTKRWSLPLQDVDDKGQPVGDYYIPVEPPVLDAFSTVEQERLDASAKTVLQAMKAETKLGTRAPRDVFPELRSSQSASKYKGVTP